MLDRRIILGGLGGISVLPSVARAQVQAQPEPPGDPRLAYHSELPNALAYLNDRNWAALTSLVGGASADSACVLLDQLSGQSAVDLDLAGLAGRPAGATIAGALLVNWGWRYRGSGVAQTVTEPMLLAFTERLERAREHLEHAIDRDANDGVAYNFLIRTMKGLSHQTALASVWEAFQAVGRKPVRAYAGMADALAAKWFGSHDLMWNFARNYQRTLEPASQALVPQAATEIILSVARSRGSDYAAAFAAQDRVLGEVVAASEAFLALPPPEDFYQCNFANGEFSFLFSFLGVHDLSRPYLASMGATIAGPWARLDDPFAQVEHARAAAGLSSA